MKKVLFPLLALVLALGLALPMAGAAPAAAHTADVPYTTPLMAGQNIEVGVVKVWNDGDNLYVQYVLDDPWVMTGSHLYVGKTDPASFPSTPGQFPYSPGMEKSPSPGASYDEATMTYTIPLGEIYDYVFVGKGQGKGLNATGDPGVTPCVDDVYIAAHADVQRLDEVCIDFEEYDEKDEVTTVSTDNGPVNFYMTSRTPLQLLSVGDTASLTPIAESYPIVAAPNTSPPYDKIVAFTVVDGSNPYRDDWIKDDGGTGAGGMTLTDPQDLTQINPLYYHAYAKDKAIVIDVSGIESVQGLDLAAIDLDWEEVWYFMYFNESNEVVHIEQVGPPSGQSGDGVAFPVSYPNPVSKVAIWGGMNLGQSDRVGYAIDNVCITSVQEETAWGYGTTFGTNWAMYFKYHIQETTVEERYPEMGNVYIGYEDWPNGDFDYNDFGMYFSAVETYERIGGDLYLTEVSMTFTAQVYDSGMDHLIHITRPINGASTYTVDRGGATAYSSETPEGTYAGSGDVDVVLFNTAKYAWPSKQIGETVTVDIVVGDPSSNPKGTPTAPRWDVDPFMANYDPWEIGTLYGSLYHIADTQYVTGVTSGNHPELLDTDLVGLTLPYILVVPSDAWIPPWEDSCISGPRPGGPDGPYAYFYDYYSTSGSSHPNWYDEITDTYVGLGGLSW